MKAFSPFTTYSSPSRTARAWMAAASEPAWGSGRPTAARIVPGDSQTHQARIPEELKYVVRILLLVIDGGRPRGDTLPRDAPRRIPDQSVLFGKLEVHTECSSLAG